MSRKDIGKLKETNNKNVKLPEKGGKECKLKYVSRQSF